MREHQIIINLRPEHYQELERLSRLAGVHSVSLFAKERILASLEKVNSLTTFQAEDGSQKNPQPKTIDAVAMDIKRLQRELQIFVAESLNRKDFGYMSKDPAAADVDNDTLVQPVVPEDFLPQVPDDLEELAERAFNISPRLGVLENIDDDVPLFSDPLDELLGTLAAGNNSEQDLEGESKQARVSGQESEQDLEQDPEQDLEQDAEQDPEQDLEQDAASQVVALPGGLSHGTKFSSDKEDYLGNQKPSDSVVVSNRTVQAIDLVNDAARGLTDAASNVSPIEIESPKDNSSDSPPISGGPPPRRRRT